MPHMYPGTHRHSCKVTRRHCVYHKAFPATFYHPDTHAHAPTQTRSGMPRPPVRIAVGHESLLYLTDDRSACQSSGTKSFVGWITVLQAMASRARVTPWVTPSAQSAWCLTAEERLRFGKGALSDLEVLN